MVNSLILSKEDIQVWIQDHTIGVIQDYFDKNLISLGEWLKPNVIDLIMLVAIVVIVSVGLKMFFYHNSKKDFPIIYFTLVIYSIIRLFWRVVLHV